MKKFYYIVAFFFFLIGFIIALQNVPNECMYQVFLDDSTGSLFTPGLMMFALGAVSGVFLGLALKTRKKKSIDYNDSLNF